ncbi:hypothetical protein BGZ60DRAFT_120559 [Tricladium varicosporioides]|nr:hypothetical protein BGZ60DRAFT_120559 [Hymenoscyphus varicosporioides]
MASAVGKIQAALAAATQETTLALANFNFDFSLVKVEAPVEFQPLGAALSIKRRTASESGDHHRTARKLGSLFEQIIPDTPRLFAAYGNRVSEIASSPAGKAKGSQPFGPFSDFAGIDGTNIWAAATSGTPAIAVHLLACMLARIWKASEAIALWEQIIAARKQELAAFDETGSIPIQSLVTSQLTVTREQISAWDASARAWLRTADETKAVSQKQLMLIIENVNIPVNRNMIVYQSVIQAWRTAMITIDKLIFGMGHSVREGSVLLGLAAWHIYPDMIVLGSRATEIRQNDPLVNPGGVITIGLQNMSEDSADGVHWSLPLAYVRYYGDPVQAEGSIRAESSRVTVDQFLQVILGALCMQWGLSGSSGIREGAKLIRAAWKCCLKGLEKYPHSARKELITQNHWLRIMSDSAKYYLMSKGPEWESCRSLTALGQKHCHLLNRPSPYATPIMGIRGDLYVSMMEQPEAKILFLRNIAARSGAEPDSLIIRIQIKLSGHLKAFEYLTAIPSPGTDGNPKYYRWAVAESVNTVKSAWLQENSEVLAELTDETIADDIEPMQDVSWFRWRNPPDYFKNTPIIIDAGESDEDDETAPIRGIGRWNPFSTMTSRPVGSKNHAITFKPIFGDADTAAIFQRVDRPEVERIQNERLGIEELLTAFNNDRINPDAFLRHLVRIQPPRYVPPPPEGYYDAESELMSCLKALETAIMVFKQLPSSTISLEIIKHVALASTRWALMAESAEQDYYSPTAKDLSPLFPYNLSRPATFSCIAFFESGGFDVDPVHLGSVMAVASENSIFVATPLLRDPAEECVTYGVQRILGNVGRSGIAFLFPPDNPKIKEWDFGFYQVVRHDEFDGRLDDCFRSTTLHLAFSGYELPIDVGNHGSRHTEAFFLEAVVSLHDRGEWVADLDVLSTFDNPLFHSLIDQPACKDKAPIPIPDFSVLAIDNWKELIDRPLQVAVVRSHGNWLARLAAAALSVRLGIPTVVFADNVCWTCGEATLKQIQSSGAQNTGDGYHKPSSVVFIL